MWKKRENKDNKGSNSQEKDPKTSEGNSQGRNPKTIERKGPESFLLIVKSARRKLEVPMPAAMPCKTSLCRRCRETCRTIGGHKTIHNLYL